MNAKIQTNGVGLDDLYLGLFSELGIQVGVSLDGTAESHNRHRLFPSGRGSHTAVAAGLDRLTREPYRHLFSGLLCTIDLRNEPIGTYKALAEFDPPRIDFLLPHGTWAAPRLGGCLAHLTPRDADWLIAVFDHWYPDPGTPIGLFDEIMHLLLGGDSPAEMLGLSPTRTVVIETDGAIELADNLKVAYHGAGATNLHVTGSRLDEALTLPGVVATTDLGSRSLSPQCRACRIHRVCGGGLYAHRYRQGTGFYNPSVYCPDLMRLIGHIRQTMGAGLDELRGK